MGEVAGKSGKAIEFISATVHELKTPLTAIIASAELLAEELQLEKESTESRLIQSIIRNARNIDERLSHFSEMSRLLVGDLRFQPEPVEVQGIIRSVTTQLYPLIQGKKQSLELELDDHLPLVRGDRQCLERILINLLTNANKFSPEQGKMKVSAWQDGKEVVIEVSDSGAGIPAEEQERIFNPYYQVNRSGLGKHSSSGLGLTITKFLVELHGGKIWLKSKSGAGSSFFVSLPEAVSDESNSNR